VEPSPTTFLKLRLNHLFHPRVSCIRAAVSNRNGSISFIKDGYEEVLSRVSDLPLQQTVNDSSDKPTISVPAITLEKLLFRYTHFKKVDLLSVDVEGHEKQVFEGLNDYPFQARIIVLEADKMEIGNILSLPFFEDYTPKYTNGVNLFLIHKSEIKKQNESNNLPGRYICC
jgi:FkbM family methyltransferase